MDPVFHNLLISAPNSGGLFLVRHGTAHRLDGHPTTGLCAAGENIFRGIQPSTLMISGKNVRSIDIPAGERFDIHDVAFLRDELYVVGTGTNSVLKLSETGEVLERWELPGEQDSYHLNCLAAWGERIVYSYFSDFTNHRGYKRISREQGRIWDLHTRETIISGLSQPHSPIACGENLLIANSELSELREYDPRGELVRKKSFDGYSRGIAVRDDTIFVGLSASRGESGREESGRTAKLVALDRESWEERGRIEISAPEIYAVAPFDETRGFDALFQIAMAQTEKLGQERDALRQQNLELQEDLCARDWEARRLDEEFHRLIRSVSWRITAPLRGLAARLRSLAPHRR